MISPKEFARQAVGFLPDAIHSIVLYGSSLAGDFDQAVSDHNVLVIARRLNVSDLNALAPLARQWAKQGNRPPLLFTLEEARNIADSFPLELLDIQEAHEILAGGPLPIEWQVSVDNLRLQLEREFKEKLLRLREQYMLAAGNANQIVALMADSLGNFLVLARGALRLFSAEVGAVVPRCKLDAVDALTKHVTFDPRVFRTISEVRAGRTKPRDVPAEETFERYLSAIEAIEKAVNDRRVAAV
jgi:hypothetical protein